MNTITEPAVAAPGINEYDHDFYAWTQHQAALVRAGRFAEVDRDNLAEEIESMGSEVLFAVQSYTRQALIHLLLLQFSPAVDPRRHWTDELGNFRAEIDQRLVRNPSLRRRMDEILQQAWRYARRQALAKLARDGVTSLPAECPYALEQVLDFDWLPGVLRPGQ